jgi:hypothetical protein
VGWGASLEARTSFFLFSLFFLAQYLLWALGIMDEAPGLL